MELKDLIKDIRPDQVDALAQGVETGRLADSLMKHLPGDVTVLLIVSYPIGDGANVTFSANVAPKEQVLLLEAVAERLRARLKEPH